MSRQDTIVLSLVYALGVVWVILNKYLDIDIVLCPTKVLFGIPCPGCGITRALKRCFEGAWGAAIQMNPNIILIWIIAPVAPFLLFLQFTTKTNYMEKVNTFLNKRIFLIVFGLTEGIIWAYNIIRNI